MEYEKLSIMFKRNLCVCVCVCVCACVCVKEREREMMRVEIKEIKAKEYEMLCDSFK